MSDIYFDPAYGRLYEGIDGGACTTFLFESANGKVKNTFIKRPVPWLVDGVRYFDAVTPYGYGGPISEAVVDRKKLASEYAAARRDYCLAEGIVCEFVRFHPLVENADDWSGIYAVSFNRNTIAVDLEDGAYMEVQFTADCRNMIRKAINKGVTVRADEDCKGIYAFFELYTLTMKRNGASDYYLFPLSYFLELKRAFPAGTLLINAYIEDKVVSSSLFILGDAYMHYHLSATHPDFYSYSANNLILKTAADLGRARGLKWLHLGGGLSPDKNDSLYRFKRSFGRTDRNLKAFCTGKAVFNEKVYEKLCQAAKNAGSYRQNYFPEYR